jgi:small subunit ribosomal protein S24
MIMSEIIVKRQHNMVRVAALVHQKIMTRKIYFLIGYTEEMLSLWLKCPVKLEFQFLDSAKDVIYKYI